MDAVTGDVASILGLLSTLYVTVVLIRRIFLQRTAWIAAEADLVVTAELLDRYDDVLHRFLEIQGGGRRVSTASAMTDGSRPSADGGNDDDDDDPASPPGSDPPRRAASHRALLVRVPPLPLPSAPAPESDGMRLAPGRSPARLSRWSLPVESNAAAVPVGGAPLQPRPSCCTEAPAIGTARFDDHPFDADWTAAVRRNVLRFAGVAGRPLLDAAERTAVEKAAVAALRSRLPLCSTAEARQQVTAAYARVAQRLGTRLCTDYFRFCAVATRIAG